MASVRTVERQVGEVERFDVIIRHNDGSDARSDLSGLQDYPFVNGAKNHMTVSKWKDRRFRNNYSDLQVDVIDADGRVVRGNTTLARVRDTYLEE